MEFTFTGTQEEMMASLRARAEEEGHHIAIRNRRGKVGTVLWRCQCTQPACMKFWYTSHAPDGSWTDKETKNKESFDG
jgi:hypothetical protein